MSPRHSSGIDLTHDADAVAILSGSLWPRFHSATVEPQGPHQIAAPAETRTPNLHRANESLLESANGSMATVATRREENGFRTWNACLRSIGGIIPARTSQKGR